MKILFSLAASLLLVLVTPGSLAEFQTRVITDRLDTPWGLAQLPDGRFLVTEKRAGKLRIVDSQGNLSAPVSGLPDVAAVGQGGLLDVALHPDFDSNRMIYLSFTAGDPASGYSTEVARGVLNLTDPAGPRLDDVNTIFMALPKTRGGRHFGSRLLFDRQGYLFISLGDRGQRHEAQNPGNHIGSMIRLKDDGSIPEDNPLVNSPGARPEIFSWGHRNIQGMALHPVTGQVWAHEHGPQGGDELNVIMAGKNYGWPVITYGAEYGTGLKIGTGTRQPGMEQPLHFWDPSIAPSGMAFYQGDVWVGALKYQLLAQLSFKNQLMIREQRWFEGDFGRIRDLRNFDGNLFLLTDAARGKLIQITQSGDFPQ